LHAIKLLAFAEFNEVYEGLIYVYPLIILAISGLPPVKKIV